jgi:hypothetical protein
MYDTSGSYSVCYAAPADDNVTRRLNWLKGELAHQEGQGRQKEQGRHKLSRILEERSALRSITLGRALTTEEAYAWFGTFLGLFPPAAIFARMLGVGIVEELPRRLPTADGFLFWSLLFLVMNAVCCFVGRKLGATLGRGVGDPRAWHWPWLVLTSLLMGVTWGIITGAAGGAVGFLIGAVVGVFCAVPVALTGFAVFVVLHRVLSRGGMIEERQLWPLAFGVPMTLAAMILGPGIWR